MPHSVRFPRQLFSIVLALTFPLLAAAQTFNATPYDVGSGPMSLVRADFNNDGFADLATSNGDGSVTILLNNGNGTFHRVDAVNSTSAIGNIVAADLNHDHFIDLVAIGASGAINVLYGRGDGTFNAPSTVATRSRVEQVAVADFNGDGNIDIAYAWNSSDTSPSSANVTILSGNGSNGWTSKDYTNLGAQADVANGESSYHVSKLVAGDFNGDGKADFAIGECCGGFDVELGAAYVYINNGSSQFTGTSLSAVPPTEMSVVDIDQDGKTDLTFSGTGCHTPCTGTAVWENLPTNTAFHFAPDPNSSSRYTDRFVSATGGDFMNTGIKMLAYSTQGYDYDGISAESAMLSFATRNADGSFAAPNSFSTGNNLLASLVTGDFNHDGKLDIAGITQDASFSGIVADRVIVYTNTTASAQACPAGTARTVNVCAPSASSTSPVRFLATPFSTTAISGMKIYVDNTAVFYTPDDRISTLLSLSAGTHSVVVKAWDTAGPFSKSFTLTVGSGGGSCTATSNRTVKICAPASGSTASSPVQILAGLRSDSGITAAQIYLDGTKVYQAGAGTTTVNQSLSMSAGTHRITVKGWDSSGSFSSSVTITVGTSSSSSCTASANRIVNICSPASGSTVSSPVRVLAGLRSDAGISAAQIYLDGTKVFQYPAGTKIIDQSISMAAGSHRITVKGWDSSGSFSSSVSITVH
jgi:hypothetical protein